MQVADALRRIDAHAEQIKNDESHTLGALSRADTWAQGDVGLVVLDELPDNCEKIAAVPQLAPGSTRGSRHCLVSLTGITMYRMNKATPLDGPIIESLFGFEIDHPDHGNVICPPGIYGVVYQRQYAEDLRAVQD